MPDDTNQFESLSEYMTDASKYAKSLNQLKHSMAGSSVYQEVMREYFNEESKRSSSIWGDLQRSMESSVSIRNEISELEKKARIQAQEIEKHTLDKVKAAEEVDKLRKIVDELNQKQNIQHLLNSVSEIFHVKIQVDAVFRSQFSSDSEVDAFVVSVDIRRSTELMLKARSPKLFAQFITTLCKDLEGIFKRNFGVVDKFTGDGILAFFPIFYSGADAGYFALTAAFEANAAFAARYKEFRTSFSSILNEVGLGIGIDYGRVHLVRMAGALTIVGQPVVYACRLGAAPAGRILLNQPAFEVISSNYAHITSIEESSVVIKGEGAMLAYDARLTRQNYMPKKPDWL